MTKIRILLVALLLAVVSVGFAFPKLPGSADGGTDPFPEHPDHVERPTAGVTQDPTAVLAVAVGDLAAWIEGENRATWFRGVAEAEAVERSRRNTRSAPSSSGVGGDCAALAAQLGLSEAVLWRESRCRWVDSDPSFCSNRGCLGPAQIDSGHFADVSPWNSSVPGVCAGLDPRNSSDYAECVSRLPDSAWR